jgi:FAD/FMN-containing dehydrogenase
VTALARSALLRELEAVLPASAIVEDRSLLASYEQDATGRYGGGALAAVHPRDAAETIAVVEACVRHEVPFVAQGGNTGLVGGGVPRDGELVISLRRLDRIGSVDLDARQIEVGAGAILDHVHAAARAAGLEFPVDHGARSAATIGGMVATNAGGPLALRYGSMRAQVAGLEACIPGAGLVRRMGGLLKDNAGYDLGSLLIGSEGTLGVITAARLTLSSGMPFRIVALCGVGSFDAAMELLRAVRPVTGLEAVDYFDAASMELVCAHRGWPPPLGGRHAAYLVVQCAAATDVTPELAEALEVMPIEPEVAAADHTAGRARLWRHREAINEALRAAGVPHKLDVGVPIGATPEFVATLRRRVAEADRGWRLYLYGHLGDGNVHVNVLGPPPGDDTVDEVVLACSAEFGGTISAEHGIGLAKRDWLHLCRTEADIAAMMAVKQALDPAGVAAPGRVLPG